MGYIRVRVSVRVRGRGRGGVRVGLRVDQGGQIVPAVLGVGLELCRHLGETWPSS